MNVRTDARGTGEARRLETCLDDARMDRTTDMISVCIDGQSTNELRAISTLTQDGLDCNFPAGFFNHFIPVMGSPINLVRGIDDREYEIYLYQSSTAHYDRTRQNHP